MPAKIVRDSLAASKNVQFLEKKLHELYSIFDVARQLKSSLDLEQIVNYTTLTLMGHYGMEAVAVFLPSDSNDNVLSLFSVRGIDTETAGKCTFNTNSNFGRAILAEDAPLFLEQLKARFSSSSAYRHLRSLDCHICVPLVVNKELRGLISLGQRIFAEGEGQEDDLGFLVASSSLIAAAIDNARYFRMAITDSLTHLYTRRYFQIRFEEEFKRARRYKSRLSVLMLDIDRFKDLNDSHGHQFGDKVLKGVADAVHASLRAVDFPARYGGDEFVAILPETPPDGAQRIADRIRESVKNRSFKLDGQVIHVSVSIGVGSFPDDADDMHQLLAKADDALYAMKRATR